MLNYTIQHKQNESAHQTNFAKKAAEAEKPHERISENLLPFPVRGSSSPSDTPLVPQNILSLQRIIGNQAVGRLIQAKLRIGQPEDKYEQEADRVADQVMRMPDQQVLRQAAEEEEEEELIQSKPISEQITPLVQTQVKPEEEEEEEPIQAKLASETQLQCQDEEREEEEEEIQTKSLSHQITDLIQPQEEEELEKETLQTKVNKSHTLETTPSLESRIHSLKGSGQPLPEPVRSFFEPRFGYDFSRVRIHSDPKAWRLAKVLNARALTVGPNVVLAKGQYSPDTVEGRRLLAHELSHVVQQNVNYVQRVLTVAQLDDKCEQQINRKSDQVLRMLDPQVQQQPEKRKEGGPIKVRIIRLKKGSVRDLVDGIMNTELAILEGYYTALENFETVWNAALEEEGIPQIGAAVIGHVTDMIIGVAESQTTAKMRKFPKLVIEALSIFGLYKALKKEVQRARKARESAQVADFIVVNRDLISNMRQKILLNRVTVRQKAEEKYNSLSSPEKVSYMANLRVRLYELEASVRTSQECYKLLSEQWVQQTKLSIFGMRVVPAFVDILLDKDWNVIRAHIKAPGGGKIAERLLKYAGTKGVDLNTLSMLREFCYLDSSGIKHCGKLDVEGKGWFAHKEVLKRFNEEGGLPVTKKLTGD